MDEHQSRLPGGSQQTCITEKEKVDDALDKGNGWPFERKKMDEEDLLEMKNN